MSNSIRFAVIGLIGVLMVPSLCSAQLIILHENWHGLGASKVPSTADRREQQREHDGAVVGEDAAQERTSLLEGSVWARTHHRDACPACCPEPPCWQLLHGSARPHGEREGERIGGDLRRLPVVGEGEPDAAAVAVEDGVVLAEERVAEDPEAELVELYLLSLVGASCKAQG